MACALKVALHWNVYRLLAYGFLEILLGLVLVAALALWTGIASGPAFRLLRRNVARRQGVGQSLRYGVAGAVMLVAVLWFAIAP